MNAREFKQQVLARFYQDIHNVERDNYDARRFSYDGVDRSNLFDVGKHTRFLDWFTENYEGVYRGFTRLADQASRDLYISVLRFKLGGHLHVRIDNAMQSRHEEARRFRELFAGVPSSAGVTGMFGGLVHYDAEWNGVRYTVDTLSDGLLINLVYRQYFFDRNGIKIEPELGDHVIDGGACTGDTIAVFRGAVGPHGHVYAFDPVQVHFEMCKFNTSRPGYENATVFPYGLSDKSVDAPMVQTTTYNPGYHPTDDRTPIPLRRIDDLVIDGKIPKIDFIKLDVEGAELPALRGSISSINRFRPKMAISIYHKPDDFFQICDFLHDLDLGYRFYLDHYTIYEEETVLYAAC
jgi:FkbM family methyltransferase